MGQESSTPIDESVPPDTLRSRTVESVAEYIRNGTAKKIVVMACFKSLYNIHLIPGLTELLIDRCGHQHICRNS